MQLSAVYNAQRGPASSKVRVYPGFFETTLRCVPAEHFFDGRFCEQRRYGSATAGGGGVIDRPRDGTGHGPGTKVV